MPRRIFRRGKINRRTFMKKLNLLALSLALILLLSSCSFVKKFFGEEEPVPSSEEISLSDYKVIVSRYFSSAMVDQISEFQYAIETKTGVKLLKSTDNDRNKVEDDNPEIVLGPTSRPQSDTALASLGGKSGYVVSRIGKKIIINGTSDYMVSLGMQHFVDECLTGEKVGEGIATISEDYSNVNSMISTVYLFGGNGSTNLSVVYSKNLDTTPGTMYGSADDTTYGGCDYLYDEAVKFGAELAALAGKQTEEVKVISDKETSSRDTVEFLFGSTDRSATETLQANVSATQYGIYCLSSSVAFFGWTESNVMAAKDYFKSLVEYCREYETDFVRFPIKTFFVATAASFAADIPQFTSGTFGGAEDSGSGTLSNEIASGTLLQYFKDVPKLDYDAYCKTLEKSGYALYASNENTNTDTNRKNYFKTYISDANMVHVYYIAEDATKGSVRLVSAKLENINLPNVKEESYTKVTDTKVTQMRLAYEMTTFGMCYILTCEDGSFILFDGGGDKRNGVESYDHVRLYTILSGLYEDAFGKEPSADSPIVISAWILTHQHWDHYSNFRMFCQNYCKGDTAPVKIEQYICNLGSKGYIYNSHNPDGYGITNLINLSNASRFPFKIVEAHTGQKIYVRNIMIEVLYTQEDMYPLPLYYYNNTSMITRMHMRVSNGQNSDGTMRFLPNEQTILFLGDLHYQGDLCMRTMYGGEKKPNAFLKSNVVQIAHHGYNGCSQDLYDVVDADILLWPSKYSDYVYYQTHTSTNSSHPANGTTYNYRAIDRWLLSEEKSGRWVLAMADDENYTIKFPFVFNDGYTLQQLISMGVIDTNTVEAGRDWYN